MSENGSGNGVRVHSGKRRRRRRRKTSLSRLKLKAKPFLRWVFYLALTLVCLFFGYRFLGPLLSGM